jgi:hypothetical protein
MGQQGGVGQPGKAVDRRGTGHRHGPRGQFVERGIAHVGRSDRGRSPADEDSPICSASERSTSSSAPSRTLTLSEALAR